MDLSKAIVFQIYQISETFPAQIFDFVKVFLKKDKPKIQSQIRVG